MYNILYPVRFAIIFLFIIHSAPATENEELEEEMEYGWEKQVVASLNLTQAQFDNWTQGGENTLAWQFNLNSSFTRTGQRFDWSTTGKSSYGQAKIGDLGTRKSSDEVQIESVYQYKVGRHINPYVSALLQTQFTKGYRYTEDDRFAVSDFFDPAYVTVSAGFSYQPAEFIKMRLGAATKTTITREHAVALTDDPATGKIEKIDTEFGVLSVTEIRKPLAENILLTSKLDLFSNLESFKKVDVRWDTILSAKVTRLVDVSINVELLYDSNISPKRQLKQLLALGLSYSFL